MDIHERWEEVDSRLETTIETNDFMEAVALMGEIAALAEEHNHHPDISVHNYKQLTVSMTSHDMGTLTDRDYKLARDIDALLESEEY